MGESWTDLGVPDEEVINVAAAELIELVTVSKHNHRHLDRSSNEGSANDGQCVNVAIDWKTDLCRTKNAELPGL